MILKKKLAERPPLPYLFGFLLVIISLVIKPKFKDTCFHNTNGSNPIQQLALCKKSMISPVI